MLILRQTCPSFGMHLHLSLPGRRRSAARPKSAHLTAAPTRPEGSSGATKGCMERALDMSP